MAATDEAQGLTCERSTRCLQSIGEDLPQAYFAQARVTLKPTYRTTYTGRVWVEELRQVGLKVVCHS